MKTLLAISGFSLGICVEYLFRVEFLVYPLIIGVCNLGIILILITSKRKI